MWGTEQCSARAALLLQHVQRPYLCMPETDIPPTVPSTVVHSSTSPAHLDPLGVPGLVILHPGDHLDRLCPLQCISRGADGY